MFTKITHLVYGLLGSRKPVLYFACGLVLVTALGTDPAAVPWRGLVLVTVEGVAL